MGTFFRRSDNPDLPAPNEPIEFDDPRFLTRGYGPNGEEMSFYNLDVRPKSPGVVYELIDRRGNPILGQLPIYDRLPGDADYSDFWHIHNVPFRIESIGLIAMILPKMCWGRGWK